MLTFASRETYKSLAPITEAQVNVEEVPIGGKIVRMIVCDIWSNALNLACFSDKRVVIERSLRQQCRQTSPLTKQTVVRLCLIEAI
jgi:hypothetical protein